MKRWLSLFLPFVAGFGCAPVQPAEPVSVHLELHLDFESDDLLDVIVFETATHDCSSVYNATDPDALDRIDKKTSSAQSLNEGSASFDFESLPAEEELTFYAHVLRSDEGILARDCVDNIVIPAGDSVEIALEFN